MVEGAGPFLLLIAVLAAAWLLLWDTQRNPRCPECYHCRKLEVLEKEGRDSRRHTRYHEFRPVQEYDCRDKDCPGRR